MGKAKKIFLLNERRETWRITLRDRHRAPCSACGSDVEWLTTPDTRRLLDIPERDVLKLAETVAVHSYEDGRGSLLFCRRSLEQLSAQELDDGRD